MADGGGGEEETHSQIKEILYKVLVVGNFGVGKTSIIRRYTSGVFSSHYKLTIGVDFALKTLQWDESTKINMQLWDIAGHERFGHMTRVYYKYAIAAIIVFDLTRQPTFESVLKWLDDVRQKVILDNEEPVPVLLLANKCDLDSTQVDQSKLDQFCDEHKLIGWFPTSAKDNTNIEEAMSYLIEKIMTISSIQLRDSSPFDNLQEVDEIDSGLIELRSGDVPTANGHGTLGKGNEETDSGKTGMNCCN